MKLGVVSVGKQPLRDYVDKERGSGEGEERLKEYPMFLGHVGARGFPSKFQSLEIPLIKYLSRRVIRAAFYDFSRGVNTAVE